MKEAERQNLSFRGRADDDPRVRPMRDTTSPFASSTSSVTVRYNCEPLHDSSLSLPPNNSFFQSEFVRSSKNSIPGTKLNEIGKPHGLAVSNPCPIIVPLASIAVFWMPPESRKLL